MEKVPLCPLIAQVTMYERYESHRLEREMSATCYQLSCAVTIFVKPTDPAPHVSGRHSLLDWSEETRPLNQTVMYKHVFDLYEDTVKNMRHHWPFYFIRPSVAKVRRQAMGKVQAPLK